MPKPFQFNMTCIDIPANDSTPVQHLDDLWWQGSIISGVNEPLLQLCCLDASLAVKPVLDRFQSVIITSGKLESWCVRGLVVSHITCIAILSYTKHWSETTYDSILHHRNNYSSVNGRKDTNPHFTSHLHKQLLFCQDNICLSICQSVCTYEPLYFNITSYPPLHRIALSLSLIASNHVLLVNVTK